MFSFAIKTLLADRKKLLIAIVGVVFSLVLVNIQGGMFLGLIRKSTLLIDNSEADIWVGHRSVRNADITADIPAAWADRIRTVPEVDRAEPYLVAGGILSLPSGAFEGVLVVGTAPGDRLGGPWSFSEGNRDSLGLADGITVDQLDQTRLGYVTATDRLEINGRRARVVAMTDGIVGFITTPYIFTTLDRARDYTRTDDGRCSYVLVKLKPGADLKSAAADIRRRLPHADVHSSAAFSQLTRQYWISRTGLGLSFGSSTLLGLAVGLVMVAQSLYAFVLDHLENYAVLKAIGATDRQIVTILVSQGLMIAAIGCLIGHLASVVLWAAISSPRLTISLNPWILLAATLIATIICVVSSLLPLARIRLVDPATVLQD